MDVILLERVGRLGNMGDVVKVKNGFGRNFLIPQKKALRASEANKKHFEAQRETIAARNAELKKEAEVAAKKLDGVTVSIVRASSDDGKLYGSVTVRDIGEGLASLGHEVERRNITLTTAIKNTGVFSARVELHPEVVRDIKVHVKRNESDVEAVEKVAAPEAVFDNAEEAPAAE